MPCPTCKAMCLSILVKDRDWHVMTLAKPVGHRTLPSSQRKCPLHSHVFNASTVSANSPSPSGRVPAKPTVTNAAAYAVSQSSPYPALAPQIMQSSNVVGGSQPHNNMMPTLFITFVIALQGIFPARN